MSENVGNKFPYPIGILLFNSPDYSRRVLKSLLSQEKLIDHSRIVISVDGFINSKDEFLGKTNHVNEVLSVANEHFPKSRIIYSESNKGIARQFQLLENELFKFEKSDWAVFLEHDFELLPKYLQGMETLIKAVDSFEEIVQVDCTGDTYVPLTRGLNSIYPTKHNWAFALRKSHHDVRKNVISDYIECISGSYFMREMPPINKVMKNHNIFPLSSSQDYIKWAFRDSISKLAVTSGMHMGRYIGAEGEHFTQEVYEKLGYQSWVTNNEVNLTISPREVETILEKIRHESLLTIYQEANGIHENLSHELRQILSIKNRLESIYLDCEREKNELKNSLSWTVTLPLRLIHRFLKSVLRQ